MSNVLCFLLLTKALQGGGTHGSLLRTSSSPNRLFGRVCRCRLKVGPLEAKVPPVFLCRCMVAVEPSLVRIQIAGQEAVCARVQAVELGLPALPKGNSNPQTLLGKITVATRLCEFSQCPGQWTLLDPTGSGELSATKVPRYSTCSMQLR